MFTFIDLFAGIGGIRLAFEKLGGTCLFSSEWDEKARETYFANFKEMPKGDITEIESANIPKHDILLAGFPCQPFSLAGVSKKNALGRQHGFADETQGTLFFEIARIIKDRQPKAFLLENVKNLRSHDENRTFRTIMKVLQKELGYTVYDAVIDAKSVLPQHRERIYLVGFKESLDFKFPEFPTEGPPISSILEHHVEEKYTLTDNLWKYLQNYAEKHKKQGNGFGYGLVDLNGPSRTLSARYYKDGAEILIPQEGKNPRRLTPKECAKLQGFPENFKIVVSDAAAYKQFGNSVAVPVVERIAEQILKALKEKRIIKRYNRKFLHYQSLRAEVIARASHYGTFFCKYITSNDTVKTGGHKGFYVPNHAHSILFDSPGIKGDNKEREIKLYWEQLDYHTDTKFKWYGKGSRSEYRMTTFGKNFPFFKDEHIGDLLIIIKVTTTEYLGYVLDESDTDAFLSAFSISPITSAYTFNKKENKDSEETEMNDEVTDLIVQYAKQVRQLPAPRVISNKARSIYKKVNKITELDNFDNAIIEWFKIDFQILKKTLNIIYKDITQNTSRNQDSVLEFAKTALIQRRKLIIKSLENHLDYIFKSFGFDYDKLKDSQDKRDVDFVFYNTNKEPIMLLSAQTSTNFGWQVNFNLATRKEEKFLLILDKGLSESMLEKISEYSITLVIPEKFHEFYPLKYRYQLLTLFEFCSMVKGKNLEEEKENITLL